MNQADLNLIGSLEEEAIKRKQRLESLKNKRKLNTSSQELKEGNLPKPVFRSYAPTDEKLKENKLPKALPESVEDQIQEHLTDLKDNSYINDVDFIGLESKKKNLDLKRRIEKDLKKLEKRTEKAIADLIRERIKNEQCQAIE